MTKKEINELINIYNQKGTNELVKHLYELQKIETNKELLDLLIKYMHITNSNINSLYYTSDEEQIVTNNTSSIIYFNKNIFSFDNINNRKIVKHRSLEVNKEEIISILDKAKILYGEKSSKINDVETHGDIISFFDNNKYKDFSKLECNLVRKLLVNPVFSISEENSVLYVKSKNGYAYILGNDVKKF